MSDRLLRAIRMLQVIPQGPAKITSTQILERLQGRYDYLVDKRTVERDLLELSAIFPIGCDDRSKPYGWYWSEAIDGFPALDPTSALACLLAGKFLEPIMPLSVRSKLEPNIARAKNALKTMRGGIGKWEDKVRVVPRGLQLLPAEIEPSVLSAVYESLLAGRRFKGRYRKKDRGDAERAGREGRETGGREQGSRGETAAADEYVVNPLGLVHRHNVAYLVCTLWDFADIVQLALHRFESAAMMDEPVAAPAGFSLDAYIAADAFAYPHSEQPITIELAFAPEAGAHLRETFLAADQRIVEKAGRLHLSAAIRPSQELLWWILGFGDQVEVIRPAPLRQEIAEIAEKTAALYGRDAPR